MLAAWGVGFCCGAVTGRTFAFFALRPPLLGVALGLASLAWFYWGQHRGAPLLLAGAAFLWGAVHHAPGGRLPANRSQVLGPAEVVSQGLGGGLHPLIVRVHREAYLARGSARRGEGGQLLGTPGRSLLQPQRFEFVAHPRAGQQHTPTDPLSRMTSQGLAFLQARLASVPPHAQAWLQALVLGDFSGLSSELVLAFRHLGLLHLLAISGMHITFLAMGLRQLLYAPGLLAYSLCLCSPQAWLRWRHIAVISLGVLLFVYVSVLGEGQAAQRALLVYGLDRLGLMLWGQRPLSQRLGLAFSVQTLLFPIGFWSEATLLSWAAYITVLTWQGLNLRRNYGALLRGQLVLFCVVAGLWGEASLLGILANLVFTPIFPPLFLVSLLGLMAPHAALTEGAYELNQLFLAFLLWLDETNQTWGALPYRSELPRSVRLVYLGLASVALLKTWRELSIRGTIAQSLER